MREEISPTEFMKRLELVASTPVLMGLDALVAETPGNTRSFIRQMVAQHGGKMDPGTRGFQLLCEMAVSYRNHHHVSDLIELLQGAGGRLSLLRDAGDRAGVQIFVSEGPDVLGELESEARRARELLHTENLDAALALYEEVLPKMETLYADATPVTGEYVNVLLFTGVLLALKGEDTAARERFQKCMNKRFAFNLHCYAALLITNVQPLRENADRIRYAFRKVPPDEPPHLAFDCFFQHASGHSFSEVNVLYDRFLEAAGDREMEEAATLSEQILALLDAKRNPIVQHSRCEFMARMFRACDFAMKGDLAHAEQEYVSAFHGEFPPDDLRRGLKRMIADPKKTLSHYFGD